MGWAWTSQPEWAPASNVSPEKPRPRSQRALEFITLTPRAGARAPGLELQPRRKLIMSIRRVAVIFDNTARPGTTGVYCRRALGQLVEVEHFPPPEIHPLRPVELGLDLAIRRRPHPA